MFVTMNLRARASTTCRPKWLGHSSFVLTLSTYAEYIREDELVAPKVGRETASVGDDSVVPLRREA